MSDSQDGELWYPRSDDRPPTINVSLWDVRAASDLVIGYDFDRDGWTIAREPKPEIELAFIPAWGERREAMDAGVFDIE